jgi:thioredoxin 1
MVKKVLKMSASWCMPCRVYAKTFESIKNEEKYKDIIFEELDIEDHEDLAMDYGVRAVPTTVLLDENGAFITKFSGNISKVELEEKLDEAISNG